MIYQELPRPGRFEVQIEISLPDENGRLQILQIHTKKMKGDAFNINIQEMLQHTSQYWIGLGQMHVIISLPQVTSKRAKLATVLCTRKLLHLNLSTFDLCECVFCDYRFFDPAEVIS